MNFKRRARIGVKSTDITFGVKRDGFPKLHFPARPDHRIDQSVEPSAFNFLSPKTREKTVANLGEVGRPSSILRDYSLLGLDAVDERRPTDQHQEDSDEVPFLQVVADVPKYVREIHRVSHESVGATGRQTSYRRTPNNLPKVRSVTRLKPAAKVTKARPTPGHAA